MKAQPFSHISGKIAVILSLLSILALSGCSAAEAKARTLHFLRIISDEEYQTYVNMVDNGQLDENGHYAAAEFSSELEVLPPEDSVHVTFAQNAYITVQYYTGADLEKPLDPKQCYLKPGDYIYVSEPVCNHPSSSWYKFDRFRMYAYDESGSRTQELSCSSANTSSLVLRIPEDHTGSEISVVPIGKYENRVLKLADYYVDSTGHHQELSGKWIINDQETTSGQMEVSPVEPLMVDFQYDADKYDFVASNPSSFYHEKGLVRFETTFAADGIEQYSVELRSLEGTFFFDPAQYPVEHGTVIFETSSGVRIAESCYIPDGQSITYTAIPEEGHAHPTGSGQITIDATHPDETAERIQSAIRFYPNMEMTVTLPQPAIGGSIKYSASGKALSGKTCTLLCGTVISVEYDGWNGWIRDENAREEYIVEDQSGSQVVDIGVDLDTLFTEAENHKPELKVVISDTMKSATFAVVSSDGKSKNFSYDDIEKNSIEWLGQNDRCMNLGKIGTGCNIILKVTNDAISDDKEAMKLDVTAKDRKGGEHRFTPRYITNLPVEETIVLYDEDQFSSSAVTYEEVTITVSKVDVSTYLLKTPSHATVSLRLMDGENPHTLQNGEVLESSSTVEVVIMPKKGYYIAGSGPNSGVYRETMKYSKWEKESGKILEKHPAEKLWYVTLDASDDFGACVYKLDGKEVSGTVGLRKGQALALEYTITDSRYRIARKGIGGFVGNVTHNDTETVTIAADASLDGQTIKRSDHITVEKKEG